jgi:hypothetical protein
MHHILSADLARLRDAERREAVPVRRRRPPRGEQPRWRRALGLVLVRAGLRLMWGPSARP